VLHVATWANLAGGDTKDVPPNFFRQWGYIEVGNRYFINSVATASATC